MSVSRAKRCRVAVIDSGVGGLSVLAELRPILPYNSVLYYADSANCPYGSKRSEQIVDLTLRVVEEVLTYGAEVVVIACNTMTAEAIEILRHRWPQISFVGMEPAVKPALTGSSTGVVGVLATEATLRGELYNRTKEQYIDCREVIEVAGVGLVEYVEAGEAGSEQCRELLASYIIPMLEAGADRIVLGCTHYPFLTHQIETIVEEYRQGVVVTYPIEIINPAPAVAQRAKELAQARGVVEECGDAEVLYRSSLGDDYQEFLRTFLTKYR